MDDKPKSTGSPPGQTLEKRPTLGFLTHGIGDTFGVRLWHGVMDTAQEKDANLICFPGGDLKAARYAFEAQTNIVYDLASAMNVDGLVISASALSSFVGVEELKTFCDRYRPLPITNISVALPGIPTVLVDGYQGMGEIMRHLIDRHGCRRLAFIPGPPDNPEAQERYQAYLDVLSEYGLPCEPGLVAPPRDWNAGTGRHAIRVLLDQQKVKFDAVVAANDEMAIGALEELQARGIVVPDEVIVTGFNDADESGFAMPPLTTVRQPVYDLLKQATQMVLAQLQGEQTPEQVILPTRLVIRQSCGCLDPKVVQAAAGPVTAAGDSFKATLASRQENILAEMLQATGDSSACFAADRVGRLLDAFAAEIEAKSTGHFLPVLDEVLRQVIAAGCDVADWHGVLSALRLHALPCLGGDDLLRAEDLWQQARVMIGETVKRVEMRRAWQKTQQAHLLAQIEGALITTFDWAGLTDLLVEKLPQLGIPSCYLSLYENPAAPTGWARLILGYNEHGRVALEANGQRFPSQHLVPVELLPQNRRYNWVVEPLYFQDRQLGFVVFEVGPRDGEVYEVLRWELCGALQGVLLMESRTKAEAALAQAYAEVEQQVEERTAELQQEIVERKRIEAQLERSLRETQTRFEISQALAGAETEDEVLDVLIQHAGLYPQAFVAIFTFDRTGGELVAVLRRQDTFESGLASAMSIGEGLPASRYTLFGHFFAHQSFVSDNVGADERFEPAGRAVLEQVGAASFAAVPLTAGNEWMGYIGVMARPSGYFDEEKQHLYQTLAEQGAVALRAARLREMIRESEQKFRAVVQSAQAIIFILDNHGVFLLSEGQDLVKLGLVPGQVVGLSAFELYRGNSSVIDAVNKALAGELAHVISTVQGIAFDTVYSPYYNLEGQIIGVVGVAIDITERKQAEESLHQRESYLTAIIENQPGLVWLKDAESRFLTVNRAFAISCGKQKPEELVGKTDLDIWPRELAEKYRHDDFMVMETENSLMTEEQIFDKGEMRWFDTFKTPVRDAQGKIIGTTGFARDITERKKAEQALRESEERLRQIASSLREVIWLRDVQTRQVLYVNPAFEELTGRTRESFYENRDLMIAALHPDDKKGVIKALEQRFEGVPFDTEHRIIHLDGSVRWVSGRIFPVRNEAGEVYRWVSIMEDITERKRAEEEIRRLNEELEQRVIERTAQLEAANKELEAFSYSVSHDLRSPLRAIDGYTRILMQGYESVLDAEGQRLCTIIRNQTRRMGQLIDELLAFSRLGRTQMQSALIDMERLVNSVFHELTTPASQERLDFRAGSLPPALGDPTLIRQVWINLLANALKFSSKRERASIEVGSQPGEGETIYFVRDNGAGFDQAYAHKLFGVFQRLHSEREFEGTGVGLAIVQRVIHRHGGRVWAEAEVDKGATFYFTLSMR